MDMDLFYRLLRAGARIRYVPEALVYHDKAVELAPNNPFAHHDRAWTLRLLGRYDDAVAGFQKAIDLWPENHFAYLFLGLTLQAMKKPDEAIEALQNSVKYNPNGAFAHRHSDRNCHTDLDTGGQRLSYHGCPGQLQPGKRRSGQQLVRQCGRLQRRQ